MAYTLDVNERLQGLCISKDKDSLHDHFVIGNVLDELVLTHGINLGDTVLKLNGESFPDIVSKSDFVDPTCILWDIELPFTITLSRSGCVPPNTPAFPEIEMKTGDLKALFPTNNTPIEMTLDFEDSQSDTVIASTTYKPNGHNRWTSVYDTMNLMSSETKKHGKHAKQHRNKKYFDGDEQEKITDVASPKSAASVPFGSDTKSADSLIQIIDDLESKKSLHYQLLAQWKPFSKKNRDSNLLSRQLIARHFVQKKWVNPSIHFDVASLTQSNGKIIAISSHPLTKGVFEWELEITKCDVDIQEVGICSVGDIDGIQIDDGGVTETVSLGARAVYGSELQSDAVWYASFNADGRPRCFRDLKKRHHIRWTTKCKVKVVVDLNKWCISFRMNGQKVLCSVYTLCFFSESQYLNCP